MHDREIETNGDAEPRAAAPSKNRRRLRPAPLVFGVVLGMGAVLLVALVVAIFNRQGTPRLTEEAYEAAVERWDARGPASYEVDLELSGNRPGQIHVEVRDGQVVHMTRDGVEPDQQRTWFYWTVPGQFDTIAQELEMARDPAGSFQSPEATQMVIWAEFDPELGYPLRYDRVVLGTNFEIHWQVRKFTPLAAKK